MNLKPLLLIFVCFPALMLGQGVLGKWKIIKKETGETRSIVKIYEEDGEVFGKVIRIVNEAKRDKLCTKCKGEDKNKKLEGLVLMKHFHKEDEEEYVDGTIMNPDDGKIYRSKIWLDEDNPNLLNVRGYVGIFYKTVQWQRY